VLRRDFTTCHAAGGVENVAGGARCRFPFVRGGTDRRGRRVADRIVLRSAATSLDSPEVGRRARAHTGPTARLYWPGVPSPWVRDRLALVRRASLARTGKLAHYRSLGSLYSRQGTPKGPLISATPSLVAVEPRSTFAVWIQSMPEQ
jgi:hypothetical protein